MNLPRRLSAVPASIFYDADAVCRVDKVYVDGVHLPDCMAYDMDAGWAHNRVNGVFQPKVYVVVKVTSK